MKPEAVAEFCFTGSAAMLALFFWLGDPGLAVMIGVPLLIGGCLASLADAGAPFRTMGAPRQERDGKRGQSGMRQPVPHRRQRTRIHG